jgi:dihydroorotate dehydrogenase (fumarate)
MDLSTTYLGLKLRTPLVVSASPLSEELDDIKRMEDAGASAIVLYSLFEEQLTRDSLELDYHLTQHSESYAESLSYFPEPWDFHLGPEDYLEHIRRAKEAVKIPIIASLNGTTPGGWTGFAKALEEAGADALELNLYSIPTDPRMPGVEIEHGYLDIVEMIKPHINIPMAVKLSPFFSNLSHMARRFAEEGADGLVLFNRFYQPDINFEELEIQPNIILSTPQALRLPMRWIAILYGRISASLAATSGIHTARDILKMLLVGADVTMLCSVLFRHGIDTIRSLESDLINLMNEREFASVRQIKGSLSQIHCANPGEFERALYVQALQTYKPKAMRR